MDDKRSCCCGAFPKGLWWLLTLLGLPLLYFFMFNANKDPIEADLTHRVSNALKSENMAWANVNVDERGRDIILSGEAPSTEAGTKALSLARSIAGVRIADGQFSEVVATEDMTLDIVLNDGKIVLDGTVASQEEMDAIVKAATERAGDGNVQNNLTISNKVKASAWLGGISGLMGLAMEGGSLSASSEGVKFTGEVDSDEKQTTLLDKAKGLLSAFNIPLINGITVNKPEPTEAISLMANLKDGKMVLDGTVASQEEMDAIVAAATTRVGEGNVTNNLVVKDSVKPSAWLDKIADLFALTPDDGSLSASANGIKYTGEVDSSDAQASLLDKVKGLLGSFGLSVTNGLHVKEAVAEAKKPDEAAPEVKQAINVCQNKLNSAMAGKSIHFRTNAAVIQQESHELLNQIASVMTECKDEIASGVSISGHTDSRGDDAYNMALSLRRAAAVKSYLQKHNVSSTLLKSVGKGETSPVASNDTREGRAKNRRITFTINQ